MTPKDIRDAWARIRKIDQTIPDDVLDFMKDAALDALSRGENYPECTASAFNHNQAIFHVGQCDICFRKNII